MKFIVDGKPVAKKYVEAIYFMQDGHFLIWAEGNKEYVVHKKGTHWSVTPQGGLATNGVFVDIPLSWEDPIEKAKQPAQQPATLIEVDCPSCYTVTVTTPYIPEKYIDQGHGTKQICVEMKCQKCGFILLRVSQEMPHTPGSYFST